MAKKAKSSVENIVKKVNREFEKTSSQIENLITDALKQFDSLQHQIQDPVRKLLRDLDELREREMKRFSDEFDRRLGEFQELQDSILERLGLASKEVGGEAKKLAKKTSPKKTTEKKPRKAATKSNLAGKSASKPSTAKKAAKAKPASRPAAKAAKPVNKNDLTLIKGIGPATAKKMKDAGITTIDQVANPSAADKEKLKAFSGVKGFDQFTNEAKKII
ncbi:MAG TPA: helix-hairpin-helix domain-containing protein [Marinobacter sp.]|nr:helix-hairpin-helix domain-containing protein [Marinobacter sp.]